MDVDREAEIGWQVAADLVPRIPSVIAAHDVPVLLHEQHVRMRAMHGDVVHAVTDLGARIRNAFGLEAAVDRSPGLAGVVAAKRASRRDGDNNAFGMAWTQDDRVQAHPTRAGLPEWP